MFDHDSFIVFYNTFIRIFLLIIVVLRSSDASVFFFYIAIKRYYFALLNIHTCCNKSWFFFIKTCFNWEIYISFYSFFQSGVVIAIPNVRNYKIIKEFAINIRWYAREKNVWRSIYYEFF